MTSYSTSPPLPLRHFAPVAARILSWLVAALLLGILMTAGLGLFHQPALQLVRAGSFAGRSYPVRAIEHDNGTGSHKRLVEVPCDGGATKASACWVIRWSQHGR